MPPPPPPAARAQAASLLSHTPSRLHQVDQVPQGVLKVLPVSLVLVQVRSGGCTGGQAGDGQGLRDLGQQTGR